MAEHLRAYTAGWNTTVTQFPNADKLDHVASITFTPLEFVTQAWRSRADAILQRRTAAPNAASVPS